METEKVRGLDSKVVYPPVDIREFSKVFENTQRDGVISIGRFTPEKNHILQLKIAQKLPNITFRLCLGEHTLLFAMV